MVLSTLLYTSCLVPHTLRRRRLIRPAGAQAYSLAFQCQVRDPPTPPPSPGRGAGNERPGATERFEWQAGFGAFSVSASLGEKVRTYIRNQEEHHRRLSFKDELISLLERHGIEYDERYMWD